MARGAAGAGPACEGGGRLTSRVSELKTASQIAAEELADPGIRRGHERTALAHAVAIRVIGYRVGHGLSQSGLARVLGMDQPAIARPEADDREPSLAALARLARVLGVSHRHRP